MSSPKNVSANDLRTPIVNHFTINSELDIQVRQIARVITHLRDELAPRQPGLIMPSQKMIRALVANVNLGDYRECNNWHQILCYVLNCIGELTQMDLESAGKLIHPKNGQPLFPNAEAFDQWDAQRFAHAILSQMENGK